METPGLHHLNVQDSQRCRDRHPVERQQVGGRASGRPRRPRAKRRAAAGPSEACEWQRFSIKTGNIKTRIFKLLQDGWGKLTGRALAGWFGNCVSAAAAAD